MLRAPPEQPSSCRRFVGGAPRAARPAAGGASAWSALGPGRHNGLPQQLATGTGERRDWLLADGSRLRLNARSKVRPLLDGAQRRLELRRGAMRLEVKEDPRGAFALDCAAGRVDCASGSLLLAEERGAIRLVTLRGSARLTTGEGRQLAVAARRSLLFDAGGLLEQGPMQAGEDAWASGWLEVHDRSLAWVAEAFRPYLPGILQLDAEIAGNRVSGLFPLDDMHTSWTCSDAACRSACCATATTGSACAPPDSFVEEQQATQFDTLPRRRIGRGAGIVEGGVRAEAGLRVLRES